MAMAQWTIRYTLEYFVASIVFGFSKRLVDLLAESMVLKPNLLD
jgi:hypothetical protein